MARSYATLDCGIWDDEGGFCALSAGAQRTYFMLVSQREIAACGTLALTMRRWGRTCSERDLKAWLDELAEHNYVLLDEDTEELLVRTFVRWDGGYKHPQRLKAVIATARAIRSRPLRAAMASELLRIGLSSPYPEAPESHSTGNTEEPGPHRFRSGYVTTDQEPESATPEREPLAVHRQAPSMFCSQHPNGTEKPCGPCGTAKMRYARHVKESAGREAEARRLVVEARRACERCDPDGWALDTTGTATSQRCDHRRAS